MTVHPTRVSQKLMHSKPVEWIIYSDCAVAQYLKQRTVMWWGMSQPLCPQGHNLCKLCRLSEKSVLPAAPRSIPNSQAADPERTEKQVQTDKCKLDETFLICKSKDLFELDSAF